MSTNKNVMKSIDMAPWDALLAETLPAGCAAVEVYATESESFSVGLLDGTIDSYKTNRFSGIGLRADCGQIGTASSEYPAQEPHALLQSAIESASVVEDEDAEFQRFYSGSDHYATLPDIDPRLFAMQAEEKIAACRELESMALAADARIVRLQDCQLATINNRASLRNSLGLRVDQKHGFASAAVSPIVEWKGEVKNGTGYDTALCVEALDFEKIVRDALENVLAQLGAEAIPSGRYGVIFENRAMISLLSAFWSIFSAESAQKGMSLLVGKEGQRIASTAVQLVDDAMHPASLFPSVSDGEGVATNRTAIIQNGELQTLLHNRKTAAKAGVSTTGNAARSGLGGVLGVAPNNLVFQESEMPVETLQRQMHNGLYITNVSGLHAGANPVSGSFSLLSRGFLIENGERVRPVDQITISGNFYELLRAVNGVANDLDFAAGVIAAPSVWIDELAVGGK